MQIDFFANSIIQEDDIELLTFLGDGGDLPPLARTYDEIAGINRELESSIARMEEMEVEIRLAVQNIDRSLAARNDLQNSAQLHLTTRSNLQSPDSAHHRLATRSDLHDSAQHRLRRVPSMDNLSAIDCERIAERVAAAFPNDPSIAPGWSFDPQTSIQNESELPYRSASYQIR